MYSLGRQGNVRWRATRFSKADATHRNYATRLSQYVQSWASESTTYSQAAQEMALAHLIKNKAEAAYRCGDLFDKRRSMMADWERYCETAALAKVVSIKKK